MEKPLAGHGLLEDEHLRGYRHACLCGVSKLQSSSTPQDGALWFMGHCLSLLGAHIGPGSAPADVPDWPTSGYAERATRPRRKWRRASP